MTDVAQRISEELRISRKQIETVLGLFKEGYSIPFIAHYRRQATAGLDENRLRSIRDSNEHWDEFEQRRAAALKAIQEAGKLTPELETEVKAICVRPELEDSFMAYRARRRTRSAAARQKGLQGLAELIWTSSSAHPESISFAAPAESVKSDSDTAARPESETKATAENDPAEKSDELATDAKPSEAAPATAPETKSEASPEAEKAEEPKAEIAPAAAPAEAPAATPADDLVKPFLNADKGVATVSDALAIARDMLAERISEDASVRKIARDILLADGRVTIKPRENVDINRGKYTSLAGLSEPLSRVPLQRYLLAMRGSGEKQLSILIEAPREKIVAELKTKLIAEKDAPLKAELALAIEESFDRLLGPGLDNEIRQDLKRRADLEAATVCVRNLRALLMQPAYGAYPVLGVEIPTAGGLRIAAVGADGKLLAHEAIAPAKSDDEKKAAAEKVLALAKAHGIAAIAIAHGTGSRDIELQLRAALRDQPQEGSFIVTVHGQTSVQPGREDLQDIDPHARFAVALARRVQDPLFELLKADPQSLNIGVHQHDIDGALLKRRLEEMVSSCVCEVGLNLNAASAALLRHIPGIGATLAQKAVDARAAKEKFASREDLKGVEGLGAVDFANAAGFVRIEGGTQPLDDSRVHPENYELVGKMAEAAGVAVSELLGNAEALGKLDAKALASENFNERSVRDLIEALKNPRSDPRGAFAKPEFSADVKSVEDLKEGMILNGVVTNLTSFGAFVDIGLPQDGLVHVSAITHRFIRDASEALSVGQTVKVKVLSVDLERKRISLSMRELEPAPPPRQPRRGSGQRPSRPSRGQQGSAATGAPAGTPGAAVAAGEGTAGSGERPRRDPRSRGPRPAGAGKGPGRGPGGPGGSGGPGSSGGDRSRGPSAPTPGKPDYSKFFVRGKKKDKAKKFERRDEGASRDEVRERLKGQSSGGTSLADLLRQAGVNDEDK
jgi:protein Tex